MNSKTILLSFIVLSISGSYCLAKSRTNKNSGRAKSSSSRKKDKRQSSSVSKSVQDDLIIAVDNQEKHHHQYSDDNLVSSGNILSNVASDDTTNDNISNYDAAYDPNVLGSTSYSDLSDQGFDSFNNDNLESVFNDSNDLDSYDFSQDADFANLDDIAFDLDNNADFYDNSNYVDPDSYANLYDSDDYSFDQDDATWDNSSFDSDSDATVNPDNSDATVSPDNSDATVSPDNSDATVNPDNSDAAASSDAVAKHLLGESTLDKPETRNLTAWLSGAKDGMQAVYQYAVNFADSVAVNSNAAGHQINSLATNVGNIVGSTTEVLLASELPSPLAHIFANEIGEVTADIADYLIDEIRSSDDANKDSYLTSAHNYVVQVTDDNKLLITFPSAVKSSYSMSWSVTEVLSEDQSYIQVEGYLPVNENASLQVIYNFEKSENLVLDYANAEFTHDTTGSVTLILNILQSVNTVVKAEVTPVSLVFSVLKKA